MKKLHVVCVVAILALAAMILIGCDQPTSNPGDNPSNPSDSWTKVETVDGLEGVWKSSVTATIIQEGEAFQTTMEMILTYPIEDGKVSIVQKIDDKVQPDILVPKDVIEQALKDGQVPVFMMECGYMYINASKTKLKIEGTVKKDDVDESTWKNLQGMVSAEFEGDVVLKNDTPTQITIIQYYNKQ